MELDLPPVTIAPPSPVRMLLRAAQLAELLANERDRQCRYDEADALDGEAAALRFLAVSQ